MTTLNVNAPPVAWLIEAGDSPEMYKFRATRAGLYTATVLTDASLSMWLLNSDEQKLAWAEGNRRLSVGVRVEPGMYYLAVSGRTPRSAGEFTAQVTG